MILTNASSGHPSADHASSMRYDLTACQGKNHGITCSLVENLGEDEMVCSHYFSPLCAWRYALARMRAPQPPEEHQTAERFFELSKNALPHAWL
jgi:hypothetical protein